MCNFFLSLNIGHQGQVERLNGTIKLMTTKGILTGLSEIMENDEDIDVIKSTASNWVKVMKTQIEIYNHTPKNLYKKSPMEVHFPEKKFDLDKYFVMDNNDKKILEDNNENDQVLIFFLIILIDK